MERDHLRPKERARKHRKVTHNKRRTMSQALTRSSLAVLKVLSLGDDRLQKITVVWRKAHSWTILHFSPIKAIWDWVILMLVMYTAIVTPYMAAFVLTSHEDEISYSQFSSAFRADTLSIIEFLVDVMFIIDIFINFRTTFVDSKDEVVSDPSKLAHHYIKGWFVVDLLGAIPFEILVAIASTDQSTSIIGLLKAAKLLRLIRVARKLDRYSQYGTALLLLLVSGFALVAHWLACIWHAIGNLERQNRQQLSWLVILGDQTKTPYNESIPGSGPDIRTKYLTALYFTLSSLTSVGFGNVSANTNGERIFTILIMLIGALMHATIFGNVAAIIQRLYAAASDYHIATCKIRDFARFYQIPSPLKQRLEDYVQYDYSYTNGIDMEEVLQKFPIGLQADICLHLNRQLMEEDPIFQELGPGCLRCLSLKFTISHCPPGDTFVHAGDVVDNLVWIRRGTVEILHRDTIIAILGKGDSFGEKFLPHQSETDTKSWASLRALTYCDFHVISKADVFHVMKIYPEFEEGFIKKFAITFDLTTPVGVDMSTRASEILLHKRSPRVARPTVVCQEPMETSVQAQSAADIIESGIREKASTLLHDMTLACSSLPNWNGRMASPGESRIPVRLGTEKVNRRHMLSPRTTKLYRTSQYSPDDDDASFVTDSDSGPAYLNDAGYALEEGTSGAPLGTPQPNRQSGWARRTQHGTTSYDRDTLQLLLDLRRDINRLEKSISKNPSFIFCSDAHASDGEDDKAKMNHR